MKKTLIALVSFVLLLSLTACGSIQRQIEDTLSDAAETLNAADSGTSDSDREIEKHNAYIDLYNNLISSIDEVVIDYTEEFGYEDQVFIEDGFNGFTMYSSSAIRFLDDALPYADKAPAEPDADAALKAMEPALRTYAQALADAKTYYEEKGYVDDDYAKAQEYHDVIIGQYDALWEKMEVFLTAVDVMLEGQDEAELAEYKESGQMLRYWTLKTLVD
ncbi:MAG: YiiG family protein, partial [Oscillospiraceae bacterium]|nr:YiiG family protein [Oscillospiraceae bacterium]